MGNSEDHKNLYLLMKKIISFPKDEQRKENNKYNNCWGRKSRIKGGGEGRGGEMTQTLYANMN
jgi:hypothetical protein